MSGNSASNDGVGLAIGVAPSGWPPVRRSASAVAITLDRADATAGSELAGVTAPAPDRGEDIDAGVGDGDGPPPPHDAVTSAASKNAHAARMLKALTSGCR